MKALLKILLLFFSLQLTLAPVGRIPSPEILSEIQEKGESQSPFAYPVDRSIFYALNYQAENPPEITNRVPQPQPNTERDDERFKSSVPDSVIERWLVFHIWVGSLINPGFSIFKLIFPYHFFL